MSYKKNNTFFLDKTPGKIKPPFFSEETLEKILHYTDSPRNPAYECFKSSSVYELHCGAKGVSKSFNNAIISIYRLVNDIRFNSVWCRNQYNHIRNSLRGTFEKAFDFLKSEYGLDYTPFFSTSDKGISWTYEDGGEGRAIFFENWEKINVFQGITLKRNTFCWGELVIDEPIEDPTENKKNWNDVLELYKIQEEKLPIISMNTVFRASTPKDFQIKIKFNYNIFTTEHFLIKKIHQKVLKFINDDGEILKEFKEKILNDTFVMAEDKEFQKNEKEDISLGCIVVQYSKLFVPKSTMSGWQIAQLDSLKESNERLWLITVAGLAYEDPTNKPNFYLANVIKNNFVPEKNIVSLKDIKDNSIIAIFDGFDLGLRDNSSLVRIALLDNGTVLTINAIEDIKQLLKTSIKKNYISIGNCLIEIVNNFNKELLSNYSNKLMPKLRQNFNSYILVDNLIFKDFISKELMERNLSQINIAMAIRQKTKNYDFSIIARQQWEINAFEKSLIFFENTSVAKLILNRLAKACIQNGENKRDEKINANIYDIINAWEMAVSRIFPNIT